MTYSASPIFTRDAMSASAIGTSGCDNNSLPAATANSSPSGITLIPLSLRKLSLKRAADSNPCACDLHEFRQHYRWCKKATGQLTANSLLNAFTYLLAGRKLESKQAGGIRYGCQRHFFLRLS